MDTRPEDGCLRPTGLAPLKTRPFWRRMDADAGGARCGNPKKVGESWQVVFVFFVCFLGGGKGKGEKRNFESSWMKRDFFGWFGAILEKGQD